MAQKTKGIGAYLRTKLQSGTNAKLQKRQGPHKPVREETEAVFGKPLERAIRYANVAILLNDDETSHPLYGYLPTVVGKTCALLKHTGMYHQFSHDSHDH